MGVDERAATEVARSATTDEESGPSPSAPSAPAAGDFEDFVAHRQRRLVGFAYLLTGDFHAAQDLVQTALAKVYPRWNRIRSSGAADSYVRRVIVNEHRSGWRRAWRHRERSVDSLPDVGVAPPQDGVAESDGLWRLVQDLPARQRAVLVLRFYEDLSERETAAVLGCSTGTVKSQASRALARLRERAADLAGPPREDPT